MLEENDLVWDFVLPLASSEWNVLFKIRCFFSSYLGLFVQDSFQVIVT